MIDNWWGDAKGPRKNANSAGVGDFVFPSNRVDYNPYNSGPYHGGVNGERVRKVRGDNQTGAAGSQLADELTVRVLDGAGFPVSSVAVTFTVSSGGGTLDGGTTEVVVMSDSDGLAAVSLTLGGQGTNTVTASIPGGQGTAVFSCEGT
jgi:hypothetical protein